VRRGGLAGAPGIDSELHLIPPGQREIRMKRYWMFLLLGLSLLLGGCATTIRSEVTAFHTAPLNLPDKSFAFERSAAQQNDLEYRRYEDLVRQQLLQLGFTDIAPAPTLKVTLSYGIESREVRVVESVVVDSGWYGPPFYDPFFRRPWRYGYGPFYDPFWYSPPLVVPREVNYQLFTRHLKIVIARAAGGAKLLDVSVRSEGRDGSLARVMPAMIRAAFTDFPGPNGVPRQVDVKLE
jgi:hypothetical protein